jgi:hypothetical protein
MCYFLLVTTNTVLTKELYAKFGLYLSFHLFLSTVFCCIQNATNSYLNVRHDAQELGQLFGRRARLRQSINQAEAGKLNRRLKAASPAHGPQRWRRQPEVGYRSSRSRLKSNHGQL